MRCQPAPSPQDLGSVRGLGAAYRQSPVGFQYGYPADEAWWGELDDPPADIGQAILDRVPNAVGLYWVDFTALQVFPPPT